MDNSLSKKAIILGAITFWIFGYAASLIILFPKNHFDVVPPKSTFLRLLSLPFLDVFSSVYPPFYVLPFLLAGYLARRWRKRKKLHYAFMGMILPIFSSLLIASLFAFLALLSYEFIQEREEITSFWMAIPIQLIFCLMLSLVFYYKKEKIIPKLTLMCAIFFLATTAFIGVSANIASQAEPILEELSQKAIQVKDVSLCQEILEESKKRKVYAENCGSLCEHYYHGCVENIAIALGDETLCDTYSIHSVCNDAECHKNVFLTYTDLCKDKSGEEKINCIQQIAIETNNVELCGKILGGIECIATIAVNTNNLNLCFAEEINYPESWKINPYKCFERVLRYTENVAICDTLKPDYLIYKDGCLRKASSQLSDIHLCERVGKEGYQYSCYEGGKVHACLPDLDKSQCFKGVIRKTKNSQACHEIKEGANKDTCFYAAASVLNDRKLCEKIQEGKWKEWCFKGIGP